MRFSLISQPPGGRRGLLTAARIDELVERDEPRLEPSSRAPLGGRKAALYMWTERLVVAR